MRVKRPFYFSPHGSLSLSIPISTYNTTTSSSAGATIDKRVLSASPHTNQKTGRPTDSSRTAEGQGAYFVNIRSWER